MRNRSETTHFACVNSFLSISCCDDIITRNSHLRLTNVSMNGIYLVAKKEKKNLVYCVCIFRKPQLVDDKTKVTSLWHLQFISTEHFTVSAVLS